MSVLIVNNDSSLEELEAVIERGLSTFIDVGRALLIIRDGRKYHPENGGRYATFEAYCSAKWGMKRAHAYRLMDAVKVVDNVSPGRQALPTSEKQVRSLSSIEDPEQQRMIWDKAVETSPNGKPTYEYVKRIKDEIIEPPIETSAQRTAREIEHWRNMLGEINQLFIQLNARGGLDSLVRHWPKSERFRFAELLATRADEFMELRARLLNHKD
jgi:hypothetical protein